MDLVSVIVPVYNVEKYLDRCITSIVNQTYKNLEIILVDDGSFDKCPEICDDWAKKDERIKVIHKVNGGLSDARNSGINIATGKYIGFVDSDDWIEPNMYEKLYMHLCKTESDIASCGIQRVWENNLPPENIMHLKGDHLLNHVEAMKALIQSTYLVMTVWNKLYKMEIVKEISFEKGKIHEDEYWSWQVIARANRVIVLEEVMYNYFQRKDSIMGSGYTGKPLYIMEAKWKRHCYICKYMPEVADEENIDLLYTCYHLGCQVIKNEKNKKKKYYYRKKLKEIAKNCKISKQYLKQIQFVKQIRIKMIGKYLWIVCWVDVMLNRA